jgi:hypothetical protein
LFLRWPLPAVLGWAIAWGVFAGLKALHVPLGVALGLGVVAGGAMAVFGSTRWRKLFIAAGFPLSLAASGMAVGMSPWLWLLPLGLLAVLYPLNTWSDAPLFPTPSGALHGLSDVASLPSHGRITDAGCGLGAGLIELHKAYPQAQLQGLEWSWPLVLLCRLRCRFATVRRADIWRSDWSQSDMVYLFQRPESMPRALAKAKAELRPGAWLVSLEFEAAAWRPTARLEAVPGKPVWLYQAPFRPI